jgi:two-component system chemotaxis response regulator CheY
MPKDRAFDYFEAGDGLSGLHAFEAVVPDVTFIDLTMPVMNGIEALEKMMARAPKSVIVVCTADVQPKTLEIVSSLGAFAMLRKPPSKENVADILARVEAVTPRAVRS